MKVLASIGEENQSINYTNRPTVKVIIQDISGKILIINNGLLPGGGVEANETRFEALHRELMEETGMEVSDIVDLGEVIQFRNFLKKKYIVFGYTAKLKKMGGTLSPQNEGERNFTLHWLGVEEALALINASILELSNEDIYDDSKQSKLYNIMTTRELVEAFANH